MAIAIVLAGGSGSRMNSDVAKQFLMLQGKEILYYSLKTFQENENISDIILVARTEDMEYCKSNIVEKYGFHKVRTLLRLTIDGDKFTDLEVIELEKGL